MSDSGFNWYSGNDVESIVVRPALATAVYSNSAGDIVIRQQGVNGEDDEIIAVPKNCIGDLIAALEEQVNA